MTLGSGVNIPSAEINLGQQRNVAPSTLGITDTGAISASPEVALDTITVPVVAGRKYRISYVFHYSPGTAVATNAWTVKILQGALGGTQLTYASAIIRGTVLDTGTVWVEWTAGSTGNQQFTATAVRSSGTNTINFRGAAAQPRILSVEWLGAYA